MKNIRLAVFLFIILCFLSPRGNVVGSYTEKGNRINISAPIERFWNADEFDHVDGKNFSVFLHVKNNPKSLRQTNNPPWWQSTWMLGAVLLVVMALLYTLVRQRIRSMRKINHELEQSLRNQTIELSQTKLQLLKESALRTEAERRLLETNTLMQDRLNEISILRENLKEQATHDPLTGLFNRRFLEEDMPIELARAKRNQASSTVAIIDIDHFKDFNLSHGHKSGDLILKSLADLLLSFTRQGDIVCRYGGEEFVVLLSGTNSENAFRWAEKVRSTFQNIPGLPKSMIAPITISLGLAGYPEHGSNYQSLLDNADLALYQAKNNGRNCTVVFTPESKSELVVEQGLTG